MLAIVLQISHCICTNRLRLQNCSVCNHLRRWACDTVSWQLLLAYTGWASL